MITILQHDGAFLILPALAAFRNLLSIGTIEHFSRMGEGHAKRRLFERGHGRCGVADLPSLRFRRLEGALHGLVPRMALVLLPAPVGRGGGTGLGPAIPVPLAALRDTFFDPKDVKAVMG